jgi:hypothetical protein
MLLNKWWALLAICLSLFSFCSCYAQNKVTFNQPIVKGAKQTYQVKTAFNKKKIVQNVNSRFNNVENHLPPNTVIPEPEDQVINKLQMDRIFHEIFNDERLQQLVSDTKYMQIIFKTDIQGNILDVNFYIEETSSLTAHEIETMERRFKNELTVKINSKRFVGYTYIPVTRFVVFDRLLKNTNDVIK